MDNSEETRRFWMMVRQAMLLLVTAIEERLDIHPRTSQLRKFAKDWMAEEGRKE